MNKQGISFYFDFISPFAYFAWKQITPLAERYQLILNPVPVVFGKLLDHWGQLSPAEIAPKREYVFKYACRYAALNKLEFNPPPAHPFNPLLALRLALKEVSKDNQIKVIDHLFNACWGVGQEISDSTVLELLLNNLSLNGKALLAATQAPKIKH